MVCGITVDFLVSFLLLLLTGISVKVNSLPNAENVAFHNDTNIGNVTRHRMLSGPFSLDESSSVSIRVDPTKWPGEKCLRYCTMDSPARVCYYHFVLENYQVMGPACGNCYKGNPHDCAQPGCVPADGVERAVMTINRRLPGPALHVCKGDTIVVDVTNQMPGTGASIHWHGLHQRQTPWMDGVPQITQCPIGSSSTFRYVFNASEPGTQFYHSHSGHHKVNGHFGALIIREPFETDPNSLLYDYDFPEHTVLAADWMHELAETLMPGLRSSGGILPVNLLINGQGRYQNLKTKKTTQTPLEVFRVQDHYRYRFRFINSASHICPLQIQIENHTLTVIASDSFALKPKMVDTIVSTAGERYDFILNANQPIGDYFIRIRAIGPCIGRTIEQFAILSYASPIVSNIDLSMSSRDLPSYENTYPIGINLNHPNATCNSPKHDDRICISDMETYNGIVLDSLKYENVNHQYILAFNNYRLDNKLVYDEGLYDHFMNIGKDVNLMGAINNISFTYPPISLMTQPHEIDESSFCDEFHLPAHCFGRSQCPCIHRIKVSLGELVELVLIDESDVIRSLNHPFHVHGHAFQVIAMGQDPQGRPMHRSMVRQMLLTKTLPTRGGGIDSLTSPLKDTVSIPSRGFAIIRFRADNPGFWFVHCHFDWHLAVGMALVLQVGELNEMRTPPAGFPTCSSFSPPIFH